jgi:hypothetical protein
MDPNDWRGLDRRWVPPEVDPTKSSIARIYDWYLGGGNNFAADREFGEKILAVCPYIKTLAILNRRFLSAAARELAEKGVTQYIDVGAGIPAVGAVHKIVREIQPDAKVVYVDNEPVAIAHGEMMVAGLDGVEYIDADLREPAAVFNHPRVRATLSPDVPTAVFLCAVMHLVPDSADPAGLIARYRRHVAPSSWLVFSHGTKDHCPPMVDIERLYAESGNTYYPRSRDQVADMLQDVDVIDPGLVLSAQWKCDVPMTAEEQMRSGAWVAVGQWA